MNVQVTTRFSSEKDVELDEWTNGGRGVALRRYVPDDPRLMWSCSGVRAVSGLNPCSSKSSLTWLMPFETSHQSPPTSPAADLHGK